MWKLEKFVEFSVKIAIFYLFFEDKNRCLDKNKDYFTLVCNSCEKHS